MPEVKRSLRPPVPALPCEAFRGLQGKRMQVERLSGVNGRGLEEKGGKSKECSRNRFVQAAPLGLEHQCHKCQC